MAARNAQKVRSAKAAKPAARGRSASRARSAAAEPQTAVAVLERERDQLKEELRLAREEIARLRQQRDQVVNHIDWVIDSLHNVLEDGH